MALSVAKLDYLAGKGWRSVGLEAMGQDVGFRAWIPSAANGIAFEVAGDAWSPRNGVHDLLRRARGEEVGLSLGRSFLPRRMGGRRLPSMQEGAMMKLASVDGVSCASCSDLPALWAYSRN